MARIEELEALARKLIGDGGSPNVFFVTAKGNVTMITTDEEKAREAWRALADRFPLRECALEDRHEVLASVEPADDDSPVLVRME